MTLREIRKRGLLLLEDRGGILSNRKGTTNFKPIPPTETSDDVEGRLEAGKKNKRNKKKTAESIVYEKWELEGGCKTHRSAQGVRKFLKGIQKI